MTRRFGVDRQLMTYREVATQGFGMPVGWLYRQMAALRELGFPKPLIGRLFDPAAIDAWLDSRTAEELAGAGEAANGNDAPAAADMTLHVDREILMKRLQESMGVGA